MVSVVALPVYLDFPEDILVGLANGDFTRFGSVIRNSTSIVAHLPEVAGPPSEKVIEDVAGAVGKNGKAVLIGIGVTVCAIGGTLLWRRWRKGRAKPSSLASVSLFNDETVRYLAAMRDGTLSPERVDALILAIDSFVEESKVGDVTLEVSREESEAFLTVVTDYTRRFAEANSVPLDEIPEATSSGGGPIVDLRERLEAQKLIFQRAA
jgi:hypothetical protein